MYEAPITAEAVIVRIRKPGLFDARLPNDKITCAHPAKSLVADAAGFAEGTRVLLELTPFDFDTARIARRLDSPPPARDQPPRDGSGGSRSAAGRDAPRRSSR